jgi:hypothetical protein
MKDETCIIYLHGNRWDDVPARQRYLMEEMSRFADVIYIEEAEDHRWRVTRHVVADRVTVVRGLMPMWIRFQRRGWSWAMRLSARWYLRGLRGRYRRVVLWEAMNWLVAHRYVPHDLHVYDCIDPIFTDDPEQIRAFARRENQILQHADVVFASAETLAASCAATNRNVTLLNNACAPQEYEPPLLAAAPRPTWWPPTKKPIAAYLGTLDSRFAFDLVEEVCRRTPDMQFVLAGLVLPEHQARVERLGGLGNVVCPGRISVEEGRYLLSRCTVGLIPFVPGPMNDAINPVKMYAYALVGKPMVGTGIRELLSRTELALTADESKAFAAKLQEAVALARDPRIVERLRAFALANTWAERARMAWSVINASTVRGQCESSSMMTVSVTALGEVAVAGHKSGRRW